MALDSFQVDWNTDVLQSFFQDSAERQVVPDSPIKHFFSWHESSFRGRRRHIGDRFKYLFFSSLNLPDEDEWMFERPMGKGSFGAVALYSKMNGRQERTDVSNRPDYFRHTTDNILVQAFVLKITEANPEHFVPAQSKKSHLTHEAAIMAQTNELNSDVLVRLRQYQVDQNYCRYYTEFCEFGTLEALRLRYKAWNKYFPELFLWHVFHCLAKGYLDFVRGRWRSLGHLDFGQQVDGQYLLHNDIKTENIFLATNPSKDQDTVWYPKPKIGDFGLATTTNAGDINRNHAKALQKGTPFWQPPEQRISQMKAYRYYYFQEDVHRDLKKKIGLDRRYHQIRQEANVWAIGAVMWNLVTLNEMDLLSDKVNQILYGSTAAARAFDGTNIMKRPDPVTKQRYSPKLWDLVCECLRMKPGDRPPPSRLLSEIETGMRDCMEQAQAEYQRTGDLAPLLVAFEQNQINDLADGGADFRKNQDFWSDFAEHLLWTPRQWGPLCPPDAPRNMDFGAAGLPSPLRRRQEQQWVEALEQRDRKRAAPNAGGELPTGQSRTESEAVQDQPNPSVRRFGESFDREQQPRKRTRHA
ncbi:serine/threonine protein kinase [Cladophialophora yegresii CBS 114405]|uniref:non-specific serine/threonine protein kinase n=1 Tax=Cladophialophora yegresii CBS 114405 TaxID=1182544 RepID=W9VVW6_9EURO|nr:serine/threonine protein kinase [Cladophialophora yegresii CBS 114405]EXJ59823.1 serine/threonine protein kinase [Cladophialophora yegresii CBS 114405]